MFKKAFGSFTDAVKASANALTEDIPNFPQKKATSQPATPFRQPAAAEPGLDMTGLSEEEQAIIRAINDKAKAAESSSRPAVEHVLPKPPVATPAKVASKDVDMFNVVSGVSKAKIPHLEPDATKEPKPQAVGPDGLTDEERRHIEEVMAKAQLMANEPVMFDPTSQQKPKSHSSFNFGDKLLKSGGALGKMTTQLASTDAAQKIKQMAASKIDLEQISMEKFVEKAEHLKQTALSHSPSTAMDKFTNLVMGEEQKVTGKEPDHLTAKSRSGSQVTLATESVTPGPKLDFVHGLEKFKDSTAFSQASSAFGKLSHFVTDLPTEISHQKSHIETGVGGGTQVSKMDANKQSGACTAQVPSDTSGAKGPVSSGHGEISSLFGSLKSSALGSVATKSTKGAFSFLKDSVSNVLDSAIESMDDGSAMKIKPPDAASTKSKIQQS